MHRRLFLQRLVALGCSAAAAPAITTLTLAAARAEGAAPLGENRLVVAILRGAMDGLDVMRPLADPAFAAARPTLGLAEGTHPLAQGFALHPRLGGLMGLWAAGELGFAHAVSTPYRDKRSHFDGQDILEAGTGTDLAPGAQRDGWLNRMLQAVPGLEAETAFAVGREAMPLLAGAAPALSWAPDTRLALSGQARLLLEQVYHDDPLFRDAGAAAALLAAESGDEAAALAAAPSTAAAGMDPAPPRLAQTDALVDFAAERLRGATRIAAFSLSGWDTHRGQEGAIITPLAELERTILRLSAGLGPEVWGRTLFLAMTEFGRTVRENGSRGTDHGTGGVMVMAGGALRGGIHGRWPGLGEGALYAGRDLMPTSDVRAWAAWAMRGLYGLDRGVLERSVFPGLDMGADPGFLA